MTQHRWSQYIAEFIGTFFLVFFGCGSVILSQVEPSFSVSSIPIIFGGTVSIMIYAVGHISGAHFNPAVTIAFWGNRNFPLKRVFGYLVSQFLGAGLASFIHFLIWGNIHDFGATGFSHSVEIAFMVEVILSFVLMFVITSVATDSRAVGELAGIAIGSTVAIAAFVGGPLTGASMNPARSLAPALFSGETAYLWVYILAPVLGAFLGAKCYEWIRCLKIDGDDTHGCC